eukprot:14299-Heterococcus_DN1.PRE.1
MPPRSVSHPTGTSARARMQQLKCGFTPAGRPARLVEVQSLAHRCIAVARWPARCAASLAFLIWMNATRHLPTGDTRQR